MGDRIRLARKRANLTQVQLAERVGVAQPTVADWEKDKTSPRRHLIPKMADILSVAPEWLELGLETRALKKPLSTHNVQVIGEVQAGQWIEALEKPKDEWEEVSVPPDHRFPSLQRFGLTVRGPSMNQILRDGSIAICVRLGDLAREPNSGEYVVVQRRRNDGLMEATIKQYVPDEAGQIWLWPRSDHPEYQAPIKLEYNGEEESVAVIAIVIGAYHPL